MKLTDLSKGQDVGASCMLAELGPFRILIDSGLNPAKIGLEAVPDHAKIDDFSLDLIILTHCHLDHLGSLPVIFKKQTQAKILTSIPSMTLAPRMLKNSFNVMRRQKEEHNIPEYPLFNRMDIDAVDNALFAMPYGKTREFEKDGEFLDITFYNAGHIPGGAGCLFKYKHRKIFFTGDVMFEDQCIVSGAKFPEEKLDTLVMETTRGTTERPPETNRSTEIERLLDTINHTIDRNGTCLIPAFALGRMHEILSILNNAKKEGKLADCPVFCSGLGVDLVDYFDLIARKTGLVHFRKKVLKELKVKPFRKNVYPGEDIAEKGIYVLSSGMLVEHTPSYLAAAALIDHPHNSICYVGYCDSKTPGGKMLQTHQDDAFVFETLDYVGKLRATVEKFDLSGHADRDELLNYALLTDPRVVVLTHGEPDAREWFEESLAMESSGTKVINPEPGKNYLV